MSHSFGDFTFRNALSEEGSQATILNGEDHLTGNPIAVKIFKNQNKIPCTAFTREAEVMRILKGKRNICQAVGISISPKYSAIAMNVYDCDLFVYAFESNRSLREREIKQIIKQICIGVSEMHKSGVAHLDLKPENILINHDSKEIAICDFGLSHISAGKQRKTKIALQPRGTEQYMAPEVLLCPLYSPFAADIYSLGCLAFVLLTGCFPIENENGDFYVPRSVHISKSCEEFLCNMLEEDPSNRPSIQQVMQHSYLKENLFDDFVLRFRKKSQKIIIKSVLVNEVLFL